MSEAASNQKLDRVAAVQKSEAAVSSSEEDEDEARQPEYLIPVLQESPTARPQSSSISITRRYQLSEAMDDDESNQFFLSEPSLSEDGDSLYKVRAPHQANPLGMMWQSSRGNGECHGSDRRKGGFFSSSEDEVQSDNDNIQGIDRTGSGGSNNIQQRREQRRAYRNPNDGSSQRHQAHAAVMSPGNTSLSSWDNSPAVKKKVFLQFVMPESKYAKQARSQQQQKRQNQPSGSRVRLDNDSSIGLNKAGGDAIASLENSQYRGAETQGRDYQNRGTKVLNGDTVPQSHQETNPSIIPPHQENQQHQQSQNSSQPTSGNNKGWKAFRRRLEGDSQDQNQRHFPRSLDESLLLHQHGDVRAKVGAYRPRRDRSLSGSVDGNEEVYPLSPIRQAGTPHSNDGSVAMTLSDSEAGDAVNESVQSDAPLDWEAHHSADDEKTIQRPLRIRGKTVPGHQRTRSGDNAAATLFTGRNDWKGMEKDRIPLPVADGDDDEESGLISRLAANRRPQRYPRQANGDRAGGVQQVGPPTSQEVSSQTEREHRPPENFTINGSSGNANSQVFWSPRTDLGDSHQAWINKMSQLYQNSSQTSLQESVGGTLKSLEARPEEDSDMEGSDGTGTTDEEAAPCSVQQNRLPFDHWESLDLLEHKNEMKALRGTGHTVLRSHQSQSPFANIGKKSAERAPRAAFLPTAYETGDPKYPTFICPRCKTIQREFFTVDNAAGRLEGPGSYLALYFAVYVICSLFIFGLEEGWMPLDCIYFAVITLTTAGLGDFVPTSNTNKIICSIFIYFGVACIGLLLGSYIAGMLDDKAYLDRKEKQMDSCPNCARIMTMKEVAARRNKEVIDVPVNLVQKKFMSERVSTSNNASAILTSRHLHHHLQTPPNHHNRRNSSLAFEPLTSTRCVDGPPDGFRAGLGVSDINSVYGLSPATSTSSMNSHQLGSPVTRQILGRQSHTRHASMNFEGDNLLASGFPKTYGTTLVRRFSDAVPKEQTPARSESSLFEPDGSSLLSKPIASSNNLHDGYSSDDESSNSLSTSTVSSTDELWDGNKSQLQAAKYVFLTLRLALINSMVIIAVGCVGFWVIEGFSLVDSWYFTTVLLTTVG